MSNYRKPLGGWTTVLTRKRTPAMGTNSIPLARNQYTDKKVACILTNCFEVLKQEELLRTGANKTAPMAAKKLTSILTIGSAPTFSGDLSRAEQSLKAIEAYVWTSAEGKTPIEKMHLALTCCQGPSISEWADMFAEQLDTLKPTENVTQVWITFVQLFRKKFGIEDEGLSEDPSPDNRRERFVAAWTCAQ